MVPAVWRDDPANSSGNEAVSPTYLAGAALAWLDVAQKQIDAHIHVRLGSCATCGEPAPCRARLAASAVFARYRALPKRRPGLALRGLIW